MTPTAHPNPALDALWMPFTANKAFKARPRLLVAAKDMHYTSDDGRQILDGTAGLWCVNAGHGRAPIVEAIARAAATLDFAPGFQMGHPGSFALAERLAKLLPEGLGQVFLSNSGSEAVDSALKIALAYHAANGEPQRTRFIGRERGYHGWGSVAFPSAASRLTRPPMRHSSCRRSRTCHIRTIPRGTPSPAGCRRTAPSWRTRWRR